MDEITTAGLSQVVGNYTPYASQGKCPNCGYCEHCGRSNSNPFPAPHFSPYSVTWNNGLTAATNIQTNLQGLQNYSL